MLSVILSAAKVSECTTFISFSDAFATNDIISKKIKKASLILLSEAFFIVNDFNYSFIKRITSPNSVLIKYMPVCKKPTSIRC